MMIACEIEHAMTVADILDGCDPEPKKVLGTKTRCS